MGADNNSHGRRYILAISFFLFVSILIGGVFLVLYMIQPESSSSAWYPIVGIALVCLPWIFWFVTCLYRFLSRKLGFRMVCWGEDVDPPVDSMPQEGVVGDSKPTYMNNDNLENQNANNTMNSTSDESNTRSSTKSSKQVHFGETVVVTEVDSNNASMKIVT